MPVSALTDRVLAAVDRLLAVAAELERSGRPAMAAAARRAAFGLDEGDAAAPAPRPVPRAA